MIGADGDTIRLADAAIEVDVLAFKGLVKSGTMPSLEQAVALYRGELLEGLNPRPLAFEDWLTVERSHLWEYATQALTALLQHYLESGAKQRAIQFGVRLLALDPLREPVHRTLMQLYAQLGRYGAALRQYQVCRTVLQRELQVAPEPATEQLHQALQAASTLGQQFSLTVLQHLIDDPDYSCRELIKPLFLQPAGREYRFVHTLIHEAIYGTLLTSQRRRWHRRAAD